MSGWRELAACAGSRTPDAWFPDDLEEPAARVALVTCKRCPARQACLEEGYQGRLPSGEPLEGIWGGTNEVERALLRLVGWQPGQPRPALPGEPEWLTVAAAAEHVGVSREAIYLWLRQGELDSRQITGPNGEPWRQVRLDQVRRRAARTRRRPTPAVGPSEELAA